MTTDIKELVKRLREVFVEDRGHGHTTEWTRNLDGHEAADALEAMAGEVERLQMKLAACGVGALANTERTVAQRITKESPYWSASLGDVYHIVDKEMEARAERDRLKAALETIAHDNVPREVFIVWRTDGSNSKHDKCQHMRVMYEDCGNCTALFARKALGGDA